MRTRVNVWLGTFSAFLIVIILAIGGWVANIVKLFGLAQATDPNYVMAALRAIGIFLAPLGAIFGYL